MTDNAKPIVLAEVPANEVPIPETVTRIVVLVCYNENRHSWWPLGAYTTMDEAMNGIVNAMGVYEARMFNVTLPAPCLRVSASPR